ncbi:hypothetical protein [Mycobacterium genavense]|uniref:hypothetical protein n=1 Tax=Mycobacterium genavense TaxID=36812 RepID=UPI000470D863|nr:hypothetical protein [Mycobacterium genavense]
MSPSELSRMFEDALASRDAWNAVRAAEPTLSRRYALSADEWEIVRNNSTPDVLALLGVPPLLAM